MQFMQILFDQVQIQFNDESIILTTTLFNCLRVTDEKSDEISIFSVLYKKLKNPSNLQ